METFRLVLDWPTDLPVEHPAMDIDGAVSVEAEELENGTIDCEALATTQASAIVASALQRAQIDKDYTVGELNQIAIQNDIEDRFEMTKAELIEALIAAGLI